MKQRLTTLYKLQHIDNQLDELESLRGDLPAAVTELENRMNSVADSITSKEKEIEESLLKKKQNELEIGRLLENQKKFKSQLFQVRNNKEYDALTKEIDHTEDQMKKYEKENDAMVDLMERTKEEIEDLKPKLDELKKELKEKEAHLKEIIAANEKEEEKLRKQRAEVQKDMKKSDYSTYMRIRKAKKGIATVTIRRSACSGCHNIVPPQRQLEIRRNNRLFFCEYCGRILVSNEISETIEG